MKGGASNVRDTEHLTQQFSLSIFRKHSCSIISKIWMREVYDVCLLVALFSE